MAAIIDARHQIRCAACGKFMSLADFVSGNVWTKVEPDSHFGPERIEHVHRECERAPMTGGGG